MIQVWFQQVAFLGLGQPGLEEFRESDESSEDVAAHVFRLPGHFHEHVDEKAASVKHLLAEVVQQHILRGSRDALERVEGIADFLEDDRFPDLHGIAVNRPPDLFLAFEVAVQPPLGQTGRLEDIAYRGVEISLDGKELEGFLDDFLACQFAFGGHVGTPF